jgi:[glutamine synthetase] adenylyltransferase / [glutamine synthetase]-adenylyl-L-tyrosine phosphorylase
VEEAGRIGLIAPDEAEALTGAHKLYTEAMQFMRLAGSGPFDPAAVAAGAKRRIAAASGFPDFESFASALGEARKRVRAAFVAIVGA